METKFKIGDTIWYNQPYAGCTDAKIKKIVIITYKEKECLFAELKGISIIGNCGCLLDKVYTTKEECLKVIQEEHIQEVKKIKKNITNIKELLSAMIVSMDCAEYTNYEAIDAYKELIKDFFDIVIN